MKIGRTIEEFKVGMQREFSHTFSQKETETMAELIGDHNPFHFDGEFVRNTRFKEPIVHGMLVGGMICHFGGDIFPGPGYLAESIEYKFLKPVYFGQTIKAIGKVSKVKRKQKRVTFSMECFNEKGEKVVEGKVVGIPFQVEVKNK